jgi:hypothetical protein
MTAKERGRHMTYRERIGTLVTAVALATGLASGSTGAVKRTAAQKCAAAKRKLVGKEAAALTKCDAAAVTMGIAVDPTCETRAKTAFTAAWARAETAGGCITTNDVIPIGNQVDAHIADLESTLELAGAASKCTAGKFKAAGKQAACELGCAAKVALKGIAMAPCLAKCMATFTTACARSETKHDCHTTGDCGAVAAAVDAFVVDAVTALPSIPTTTSTISTSSSTTTTAASSTTTTTTMPTIACGTFITKWGSFGSGDGQFNDPEQPAVDANGNVFVVDTFNNRIEKFTSDGAFLTKWDISGSAAGQFTGPQGVGVDGAGNVFVADTDNNRIVKFTNTGTFLTSWGSAGAADGQFSGPCSVAADANGNVFVADRFNNRIQKFTGTGTFLGKWGSVGSADGQFSNPIALAVDGNLNVFVVDHFNNRIQKFTNTGTFLTKWGSLGLDEGQFSDAESIAVDADGDVFVADVDRIQKFTNAGAFVTEWGSLGSADGQFNSVLGVAADGDGAIYTTDFNHRVQKFACP